MNNVLLCVCARLSFYEMFSEGPNGEDDVRPPLWDDVALLPEQAQQQVLGVPGPVVDPGALEPGGNVSLECIRKQHGYQSEVQAALLDELMLDLIVNILGVQAVLFVSISLHVLPVLGADDHDDEDRFVIQKAVHPFVDAHPSDRIVKDVDCWVEPLISQKFGERKDFFGRVH